MGKYRYEPVVADLKIRQHMLTVYERLHEPLDGPDWHSYRYEIFSPFGRYLSSGGGYKDKDLAIAVASTKIKRYAEMRKNYYENKRRKGLG